MSSPVPVVEVRSLWKVYRRSRKAAGLRGSLRALLKREVDHVEALRGISFTVREGEILGYIGPNGAGKTTTLKILAGVLYPTRGDVRVLGFVPWHRERAFLKQISFVLSGRGFLEEITWDLSVLDGLRFVKELYGLRERNFRHTLDELVEFLQLEELLFVPLRQLSHGQRARVELAAALLWKPRLLLLDEPTLGLDVLSQKALRDFIKAYVCRHGASCVITSHYMRDIEELADRLLLIDQGRLLLEGPPEVIVEKLSGFRRIRVTFEGKPSMHELKALAQGIVVENRGLEVCLEVPKDRAKRVAQELLARWPVLDLTIEEPGLEEALQRYFSGSSGPGAALQGEDRP